MFLPVEIHSYIRKGVFLNQMTTMASWLVFLACMAIMAQCDESADAVTESNVEYITEEKDSTILQATNSTTNETKDEEQIVSVTEVPDSPISNKPVEDVTDHYTEVPGATDNIKLEESNTGFPKDDPTGPENNEPVESVTGSPNDSWTDVDNDEPVESVAESPNDGSKGPEDNAPVVSVTGSNDGAVGPDNNEPVESVTGPPNDGPSGVENDAPEELVKESQIPTSTDSNKVIEPVTENYNPVKPGNDDMVTKGSIRDEGSDDKSVEPIRPRYTKMPPVLYSNRPVERGTRKYNLIPTVPNSDKISVTGTYSKFSPPQKYKPPHNDRNTHDTHEKHTKNDSEGWTHSQRPPQEDQEVRCKVLSTIKEEGLDGYKNISAPVWMCVMTHESNLTTSLVKKHKQTKNYGIFQLSHKQWCKDGNIRSKNLCKTDCSKFSDDNISDDIECAKLVLKRTRSMKAWPSWMKYCTKDNLDEYTDGC